MKAFGSKQIKLSPDGCISIEDGSRWNEMRDSVEDHIRFGGLTNAPSNFNLRDQEIGTSTLSVARPVSESVKADVQLALGNISNAMTLDQLQFWIG